ncbi:MAG: transposase [Stutzerimonas stutzeri]|nr:MAG: transposase [Stutzerimonas stutzeri]
MISFSDVERLRLLQNGEAAKVAKNFDPQPVLKLFAPWCAMTWLISEMSPDDNDVLFGLADLGTGAPEVGAIVLSEIAALQGPGGLSVEIDRYFSPRATLNEYASEAILAGKIIF